MEMFNKTKEISFEIDEGLYKDFCVACARENINDVFERLIRNYIHQDNSSPDAKETIGTYKRASKPLPNSKEDKFKYYLVNVARKSTGDHYTEKVSGSYFSAVNTTSRFINRDLWQVNSSLEMYNIVDKLMRDPDFVNRDLKTQRTLSNGIKRYQEFLEYVEKNLDFINK